VKEIPNEKKKREKGKKGKEEKEKKEETSKIYCNSIKRTL